jgi:hypothetical protein
LSVHLLFAALSRDGALWQRFGFSADGARMSTFTEGGLFAFAQTWRGKTLQLPPRSGWPLHAKLI